MRVIIWIFTAGVNNPSHPKSGPKAPISGGPQRAKRVMEHPKGGFLKKRQNDHHEQDTVHIPLLMMTRWLGKVIACVFFVRISGRFVATLVAPLVLKKTFI